MPTPTPFPPPSCPPVIKRNILRSQFMHGIAAEHLQKNPALVSEVLERLAFLRESCVASASYFDEWERLLKGPLPRLLAVMVELSERASDLRKASPCLIIISPQERDEAFKKFADFSEG